jgi:hypothetical protein
MKLLALRTIVVAISISGILYFLSSFDYSKYRKKLDTIKQKEEKQLIKIEQ